MQYGYLRYQGKRAPVGIQFLDLANRPGNAREARQGQGEFLRNRLADIDEIAGERLEGRTIAGTVLAFSVGRPVAQGEICCPRALDRIERHGAALHKSSFERGVQQDDARALADQLDLGSQPVETEEIKAARQCLAFRLGRGHLLAERLGAKLRQRNNPRKFGPRKFGPRKFGPRKFGSRKFGTVRVHDALAACGAASIGGAPKEISPASSSASGRSRNRRYRDTAASSGSPGSP